MKELGELRKRLSDKEAAPYMGYARTLLGMMKEQMARGSLLQLQWTKDLADGVKITVMSAFGNDEIRIDVPPGQISNPIEQKPLHAQLPIIDKGLIAVGSGTILKTYPGGGNYKVSKACMWKNGIFIDLTGGDTSDNSSWAQAISADGSTIVGEGGVWNGNGAQKMSLPGVAYDVSGDGSAIVIIDAGADLLNFHPKLKRWSEKGGVQEIGEGQDVADNPPPRISPNGKYIVCNLTPDRSVLGRIYKGYVIVDGAMIPVPGDNYAVDVSDNGTVLAWSLPVYPDYHATFTIWNCETGEVSGGGDMRFPKAISADGATACGFYDPGDTYQSAYWRKKSGVVPTPPSWIYGAGGVRCVTDDGAIMGGDAPGASGGYWDSNGYTFHQDGSVSLGPTLWHIKEGGVLLQPLDCPLMNGSVYGVAAPPVDDTVILY